MKILITGACGFVGATLCKGLIDSHEIVGMDNFCRKGSESNRDKLSAIGVDVRHGDVRVKSDLESLPRCDYVIDCAALPSVTGTGIGVVESNLFGTVNTLEYCKLYSAGFIMLSTSRVYSIGGLQTISIPSASRYIGAGDNMDGIYESFTTSQPISLYGATKLASEVIAREYSDCFPVNINRCGVMAGGGQFGSSEQGVFSYWIRSWRDGKPLKYTGFGSTGRQTRDILNPKDLVSLIENQILCGKNETINVGGGIENSISLLELSSWCEQRFGKKTIGCDPVDRPFDVPWLVLNCEKAKEIFCWKPTTKMEDTFEEIANT
jgi:CDP-paratose 2-epimerase